MSWQSSIADALTAAFNAVGQSATFTPASGDPVSLTVNVTREVVPQGYDATAWTSEYTVECILADLPREPDRGETFTIDGTSYTVREVMDNNGYTVKMVVS